MPKRNRPSPPIELKDPDGVLDPAADALADVIGEQLALAHIAELEKRSKGESDGES